MEFSKSSVAVVFDPKKLNDRQLFEYCQKVGAVALKARREFSGVLPLVERRRAYEGRGFYSLYDFAAKVGGIGRDIVTEVLRLDVQLRDFPLVRKLLYSGRVSWSKIRMVMHWLTIDDQEIWIQKLENMSVRALTVYMKDFATQLHSEQQSAIVEIGTPVASFGVENFTEKYNQISSSENIKNLSENKAENFGAEISEYNRNIGEGQIASMQIQSTNSTKNGIETSRLPKLDTLAHFRETMTFSLRSDLAARLRLFRQRMEKERHELITWEEVIDEFLKMVEGEAKPQAQPKPKPQLQPKLAAEPEKPATRHIPNAMKREVLARYNGLCAFRNCPQPAEILHHTDRFALTKDQSTDITHHPDRIKPLCKPHERVIHNTLIANETVDPATWKLVSKPDPASDRYEIDQMVAKYRKPK